MFCKKCGNNLPDEVKFCGKCGDPIDQSAQVVNTSYLVLPASILRRLSNYLIDSVVVQIISGIFYTIGIYFESVLWSIVGGFIYLIGYYIICESIWGKTVGKLITKTKVVDRNGNKPDFLKILGRSFARWIPFEQLSFLIGGFPIGWHDSLSKTYVVSNSYTPEEVKQINPEEVKRKTSNNVVVTIIIIIIASLFLIAVIGILSSVVLASLNTARTKAADAAVKSNLASLRTQALLYEDENKNYSGFCSDSKILEILKTASKAGGLSEYDYVCNDSDKNWAISSPLKSEGYWCVDDSENDAVMLSSSLSKQTSCSSPQVVNEINEEMKVEFVNSCAEDKSMIDFCSCAYDKLEEKFGFGGIVEMGIKYEKTGVMEQKFIDTISSCQSLIK